MAGRDRRGIVSLALARGVSLGTVQARAVVRVTNPLGTGYPGSVIVNEANGLYYHYEPAPGRSWLAG